MHASTTADGMMRGRENLVRVWVERERTRADYGTLRQQRFGGEKRRAQTGRKERQSPGSRIRTLVEGEKYHPGPKKGGEKLNNTT